MGDRVTVEPSALRSVGQALTTAAEESGTAFTRHDAALSDAAAGLFSGSAAALQAKSGTWRATTSALTQRVDDHGGALHTSAALFEKTDTTTSTALYQITDDESSALNLDT